MTYFIQRLVVLGLVTFACCAQAQQDDNSTDQRKDLANKKEQITHAHDYKTEQRAKKRALFKSKVKTDDAMNVTIKKSSQNKSQDD